MLLNLDSMIIHQLFELSGNSCFKFMDPRVIKSSCFTERCDSFSVAMLGVSEVLMPSCKTKLNLNKYISNRIRHSLTFPVTVTVCHDGAIRTDYSLNCSSELWKSQIAFSPSTVFSCAVWSVFIPLRVRATWIHLYIGHIDTKPVLSCSSEIRAFFTQSDIKW